MMLVKRLQSVNLFNFWWCVVQLDWKTFEPGAFFISLIIPSKSRLLIERIANCLEHENNWNIHNLPCLLIPIGVLADILKPWSIKNHPMVAPISKCCQCDLVFKNSFFLVYHVGSEIRQTVAPRCCDRNSAPFLRAPVPLMDCAPKALPSLMAGQSSPNKILVLAVVKRSKPRTKVFE